MLYRYGTTLGVKLLFRGQLKASLPYLIKPVNYWRRIEYQLVSDAANFQPGDRVLDIGSPKLLSLYLAEKVGAEVFSTDIENYFIHKLHLTRDVQDIPLNRLHILVQDGRMLGFDDNSFDKVYSISVLEHIPGEGDTECVKEIKRVLSKNGRCVITVPFAPTSKVEYKNNNFYWAGSSTRDEDGHVFYQRRYSEQDLFTRLVEPSGLKLKQLSYFGERVMTQSERELSDFLPAVTGPVQPALSKLFHTGPVAAWQSLEKPLGALVVLEK